MMIAAGEDATLPCLAGERLFNNAVLTTGNPSITSRMSDEKDTSCSPESH